MHVPVSLPPGLMYNELAVPEHARVFTTSCADDDRFPAPS